MRSRKAVSLDHHMAALDLLHRRGPDLKAWRFQNDIFIGQTVLSFNEDRDFYTSQQSDDFLVFNGEIYGQEADARLTRELVIRHDWKGVAELQGPWAWIWTDFEQILWATDPQHEKHLFVYQDSDWLIITSEMPVILHYLSPSRQLINPPCKHLPILDSMPWSKCTRAVPGRLYRDGRQIAVIDDMTLWAQENYDGSYSQAVDDLDNLLTEIIPQMIPDQSYALTLSGGLDSGLLQTYLPRAVTCTAIIDKDPVCATVKPMCAVQVDPERWADSFRIVADRIQLPVMTWGMITLYTLINSVNERAVFMGSGADELFGGYPYHLKQVSSPYSHGMLPGLSNFLADFIVQSGGVDMLGADLVAGLLGKEIRLPFVHPRVVKFALSLPRHYKIAQCTKVVLRDLYRERVGVAYDLPKQGFTGHCNDSIPYLDPEFHIGSDDRLRVWRDFVLHWFQYHA